MKIIDVICDIPGLNAVGQQTQQEAGYQCQGFRHPSDEVALATWTPEVCERLLQRNDIDRGAIGLILNASVSLFGTTTKGNSAAPGLGNAIQRALGIDNAFVFELFHGDWCTALEVANNFLAGSQFKYGLIVHAEKLSQAYGDATDGFTMADGVSAILFEGGTGEEIACSYHHMAADLTDKAQLHIRPNEDLRNEKMQFRLQWRFDSERQKALSAKLGQIAGNLVEQAHYVAAERWFPAHFTVPGGDRYLNRSSTAALGKHEIPWILQDIWSANINLPQPVSFISFNPFLSYYSTLTIRI